MKTHGQGHLTEKLLQQGLLTKEMLDTLHKEWLKVSIRVWVRWKSTYWRIIDEYFCRKVAPSRIKRTTRIKIIRITRITRRITIVMGRIKKTKINRGNILLGLSNLVKNDDKGEMSPFSEVWCLNNASVCCSFVGLFICDLVLSSRIFGWSEGYRKTKLNHRM